jgi:DNA-binding MarR family transcriptional regulator
VTGVSPPDDSRSEPWIAQRRNPYPQVWSGVTELNPSDYLLTAFERLSAQIASMTVGALRHLTGPTDPLRLLEYRVLVAVGEETEVSVAALETTLTIDRALLAGMLDRLETRTLIRRTNQEDGYESLIWLTGFGSALLDQVAAARQRWLKPALRGLNAWERSTLIGALRYLIGSFPPKGIRPKPEPETPAVRNP